MIRLKNTMLAFAVLLLLSGTQAYAADTPEVQVGFLRCEVDGGFGFIFGSTKDVKCTYEHTNGTVEKYTGSIRKYGVDIGYTKNGVMLWGVLAATPDVPKAALKGEFVGVSAEASVGLGVGANVLVLGGDHPKFALQPLSIQGMQGVNVAAGIGSLQLNSAE